jgi:Leucine Rich Repeat (LRR) protein
MCALLLTLALGTALDSAAVGEASAAAMSTFLARVDATPWPANAAGKVPTNLPPRIERDDDGNVIRLRLDGMQLSKADLGALVLFDHLKELSLSDTNIKDEQIPQLAALRELQWLRLNHTDIGDDGAKALASVPKLSSLCLGGVRASREAVNDLKKAKPKLSLGYYRTDK